MANRRRPTFLIVGAMKSGTSSLYESLRRHPQVFLPGTKELNALLDPAVETPEGFDRYLQSFARAGDAIAVGEASPNYTKRHDDDGVAERARRLLGPELAVIYLVRDPVDRLVSHVNHTRLAGRPFDPDAVITCDSPMVQTSRYHHQIEPWLAAFGPGVLVLDLASFEREPDATLRRLCTHLGVDPDAHQLSLSHQHATASKRSQGTLLRRYVTGTMWYGQHVRDRLPDGARQQLRRLLTRAPQEPMLTRDDLRIDPAVVDLFNQELDALARATGVQLAPVPTP